MTILRLILPSLFAGLCATSAMPADPEPPPEHDPRGAVLCYWRLYMGAEVAGDRCFPGDPFNEAVKDAMGRMEAFIIENKPTTRVEIDATKRSLIEKADLNYQKSTRFCALENFSLQIFRFLKERGKAALEEEMTKLLAVPRKPVMNPCI